MTRTPAFFLAATFLASPLATQTAPGRAHGPVTAADAATVDAVVSALYGSVSHGPDAEPDWKRMRSIFLPVGMLIPPKRPREDMFTVLDVDGFQERVQTSMAAAKAKGETTAFFEKEVARRTDCFGNVCQIFSTYEARHAPADEKPFVRGINSIQLVKDGISGFVCEAPHGREPPVNRARRKLT